MKDPSGRSVQVNGPICPGCSAHVPWTEVSSLPYHWCPSCGSSVRPSPFYERCLRISSGAWAAVLLYRFGFHPNSLSFLVLMIPAVLAVTMIVRPLAQRIAPPTLTFGDDAPRNVMPSERREDSDDRRG